jgi:hypothetical protein
MNMLRVFKIILLSLLTLGITSSVAIANMAAPWNPGDLVGEPTGSFRSLSIIREKLSFDLRALNQGKFAQITATYQIRNEGEPNSVQLLFVAPAFKAGSVTVDRVVVPSVPVKLSKLPPEWQAPKTVPAISNHWLTKARQNPYDVNSPSPTDASGLRFAVALPKGEHSLQVSYDMQPSTYNDSVYRDYQIAYILAPARSWAKFGLLQVEVDLPPNWKVATSLPMKRTGDTLRASFNSLPANSLAIVTRPPVPPLIHPLSMLLQVGGAILGLMSSWWLGEVARRQVDRWGWGDVRLCLSAIVMMPLGGTLFIIIAWLEERLAWNLLMSQLIERHISHSWTHGHDIITLLVLVLGFFVSSIATMVAIHSPRRSVETKASR